MTKTIYDELLNSGEIWTYAENPVINIIDESARGRIICHIMS